MKGMVVTVGLGEGVHEGIAFSIQSANPNEIIFVVSKDSRGTLERIAEKLESSQEHDLASLCRNESTVVEIPDPEDIDSCYEAAKDAFRKLIDQGLQSSQLVADFTSGTKAMSAGLVMAAVQFGCETLSYVGGGKRNCAGRVVSGAEKVHIGRPSTILRDLTLRDAVEAFNRYQFAACRVLVERLIAQISPELLGKAESLATAAAFYEAWDRFDHKTAAQLGKDLKKFDEEWEVDTHPNREVVARIAKAEEETRNDSDPEKRFIEFAKSVGDVLMADLLANADRRSEESRYDDAVARLYRVIELAAQVAFARKYCFSTGRVPVSFLRERNLESKYANANQKEDGEYVKLGLRNAYELLADLGEDLGRSFVHNKELRDVLQSRNESILAHGLSVVPEEAYKKLFEYARNLCRMAASSGEVLDSELEKCCFPKIQLCA